MLPQHLVRAVDAVLNEHGFARKKMTWNRRSDGLVDVVDLQVSKGGESVTLNAGVVDRDVRKLVWGAEPREFFQEPEGTVRSRVGQLIGDHDVWWPLDEAAAEEISRTLVPHVLPFLDRMHDPLEMEAHLSADVGKSYPPPIIYLAILKHRRGQSAETEALLSALCERTSEPWQERIAEIWASLGSAS
jgi:hypothetical protein